MKKNFWMLAALVVAGIAVTGCSGSGGADQQPSNFDNTKMSPPDDQMPQPGANTTAPPAASGATSGGQAAPP